MSIPANILADVDWLLYLGFFLVFSVIGGVMEKLKKSAEEKARKQPSAPKAPRPAGSRPRPPVTSLPRPIIREKTGPRPPAAQPAGRQPTAQRPRLQPAPQPQPGPQPTAQPAKRPPQRVRQAPRPAPPPVAVKDQRARPAPAAEPLQPSLGAASADSGASNLTGSLLAQRPRSTGVPSLTGSGAPNPQELRRAIIFAELLSPPLALRDPAASGAPAAF